MPPASDITLWHVPVSHYSEKARWALDFKRVPHTRRTLLGGVHPLVTYVLTRGEHHTVPVLTIAGRSIGDSTAIIAELEARFPDRPLYPADPGMRRRALELEGWFDVELGPYIRRWAYHALTADPQALVELTYVQVPWARPGNLPLASTAVKLFLDARFRIRHEARAREAQERAVAALDRLEAELDGRDYLCGDNFSVADLTAASLFYGLVMPAEGPWSPGSIPPSLREATEALADRPGARWIRETYARHRLPSPAVDSAAPGTAPA